MLFPYYASTGEVHYSIYSGNDGRMFAVNASSGVVMLISPLDYEAAANHTLIVRASDTDPGGHARFAVLALCVRVQDVNDNPPKFAHNVTFVDIPETLTVGKKKLSRHAS